jgi:multiple sugar transport system permease protein
MNYRSKNAELITKTKNRNRFKENVYGYLFIGPWLICFIVFMAIPFVTSFVLSFTDYNMLSEPKFIGLNNYIELFTKDKLFWQALSVTFRFVFLSVPLRLLFALAIALLLNRQSKLVPLYRCVYYLPSILGGSVAVSVMWKYCFSKTGVVNIFLNSIGIPSDISWISNKDTALWSIILLFVWQFGSSMLIFLAGLKQIPKNYYEAATVDGAGVFRQFFNITLPLLTPIILFNTVMQIIGGFMVFTQAMIITDGGPVNKTLVYVLYLYQQSFKYYKMGYGSAMAWVLLLIVGFFTALIFKSSNTWVFYENESKKPRTKKLKKVVS